MPLLTRQKPVTSLDNPLLWLAIYEDDYRKVGADSKICHSKLSFLWPSRSYAGLRHA